MLLASSYSLPRVIGLVWLSLSSLGCSDTTDEPVLNRTQYPRFTISLRVDAGQTSALIESIKAFAARNGFSMFTRPISLRATDLSIEMERKDIRIAGASPFSPSEFKFGFFEVDRKSRTPTTILDPLRDDFLRTIKGLNGVKVTRIKEYDEEGNTTTERNILEEH